MTDLKTKLSAFTRTLAEDAEPLWASQLAILIVLVGSLILIALGVHGELYEWGLYLALGTIYPALLLFLTHRKLVPGQPAGWLNKLTLALGAFCALLALYVFFRLDQLIVLVFVLVHFTLIKIADRKRGLAVSPSWILITFVFLTIAWKVSTKLLWWATFPGWFFSGDNLAETVYRFTICALALVLVFFTLRDNGRLETRGRTRFLTASNVFAMLVIALASVRSDQLFNTMAYSHWGVVIGPAEMVRQGGWLLWDVPAQYGFLNTLVVAALPFKSVWQSAYFLNSLLLFLSAGFLFFVLRSISIGVRNYVFSLAVTLAAVFLMSGWPPALLGPQVFPSIGPFRFFWCYALLAVLIWEFNGSGEKRYRIPFIGTLLWLIGSLWSSESAVYCAAIWLPAYTLIAIRRTRVDLHLPTKPVRVTIAWLIAPIVVLVVTLGLISAYYLLRLGHGPDWRSFYEYSFSFAGGFFSIPISLRTGLGAVPDLLHDLNHGCLLSSRRLDAESDGPHRGRLGCALGDEQLLCLS